MSIVAINHLRADYIADKAEEQHAYAQEHAEQVNITYEEFEDGEFDSFRLAQMVEDFLFNLIDLDVGESLQLVNGIMITKTEDGFQLQDSEGGMSIDFTIDEIYDRVETQLTALFGDSVTFNEDGTVTFHDELTLEREGHQVALYDENNELIVDFTIGGHLHDFMSGV